MIVIGTRSQIGEIDPKRRAEGALLCADISCMSRPRTKYHTEHPQYSNADEQ